MEMNEMSEQARAKVQELKETGSQFGYQTQQAGRELKEAGQDWAEQAMDKGRDLGRKAESYMREDIWPTVTLVGIFAFALGYLVGSRD